MVLHGKIEREKGDVGGVQNQIQTIRRKSYEESLSTSMATVFPSTPASSSSSRLKDLLGRSFADSGDSSGCLCGNGIGIGWLRGECGKPLTPLGPRLFTAEMGLGPTDATSCWIERVEGLK